MKTRIATIHVVACLIAAFAAVDVSARTVYDAGKAFNEAGHNKNAFGPWSLLHASGDDLATTSAFDETMGEDGPFAGIGGKSSPWIRVNTGSTSMQFGEEVLPNELLIHPANPKDGDESYPSDVVRFTAPQDGWYSAVVFAHDCAKNTTFNEWNPKACAGVQVTVRAGGNVLVRQIVSLEDQSDDNPSHRFDFQVPVRHLAAGETIEVVVGNKSATSSGHTSDTTGLRFIVTKEDEGAFYDSGIAMTNCVAQTATYANPYGNIKDGSWYFLTTTVPSADADLTALAPGNFSRMSSARISAKGTLSGGLVGFGTENNGSIKSPYVMVNSGTTYSASTAPCELQAHPTGGDNKKWTTIRFRPPVAGYYSASVVARHINNGTENYEYTGVDVYLLASDNVVTNAYVFMKDFSATTARLTFDARLFAAGEPVDIVIAPHGDQHSDATAVSAIFRREDIGVYDAGRSYYEEHASGRCSNYFSDTLDGNAKWLLASKADPWAEAHSALPIYLIPIGNHKLTWWVHAVNNQHNGTAPCFAMAADGIVSVDSLYLNPNAPILATTPYELVVQPQNPPQDSSAAKEYNASLRAKVPSNGIYRVRSYARDLNNNTSEGDGVRMILSANSYAPASAIVSYDSNDYPYEAALAADRLWLRQGEALYFTVDPRSGSTSDLTALSACYEICDASPSVRVINVDFAGAGGAGRLSSYSGVGREGWSDWTRWNALRPGDSAEAAAVNCREADGATRRNATVTIVRGAGNIAKVTANGASMLESYVSSDGADDTYTFTISELKKNEPYTLYLYSAKGDTDGNAVFTVGGVTKAPDETWNLREKKVLTRFDVVSDSEGRISGTFAAADAAGGAFNGLTLVGEFPEYEPLAMIIILR